ncbi:MAG: PAS-domain containing protein [Mangrovicoccus sp.]|nr:PAS-domain containing protein [Mangrovicoccus sp.]
MSAEDPKIAELTQAGLNLIQQALSIYDADLRLVVANRRFRDMFDLPLHLVTPGVTFAQTLRYLVASGEYADVEDPEDFVAKRVETARAFEPHYVERRRANGRMISIEGSPLPQGGWVAVYTDITSIKRQEQLLRARSEDLAEKIIENAEELARTNRQLVATNAALTEAKEELMVMEARARLTAEMMPAHIAHIDLQQRYTYSNRRLSHIMPGRPSEIIGSTIAEALGAETFSQIEPALEEAYGGEGSIVEFTYSPSNRRVRVAFTPDEIDGQIRGVHILSIDVTQEVQAREALVQTHKRELAAKLTSGLAHDFSNLLTIILGLQGQLSKLDLAEMERDLVSGTIAAARRGGQLLDRMAGMSGPPRLRYAPTDMEALMGELRALAAPVLPDQITLSAQAFGFDGPVLIDPGAVQDQLINLILNARDAMGKGPGQISVSARPDDHGWMEISVCDSGPGFSQEALRQGFDLFFTTKGSEGSGLGLCMVYDHARLMGGTARLSNTGQGAMVLLQLPLRRPAPEAGAAPRMVLLVEDNDDIRQTIREDLVALGHQVLEATSVEEAEQLADIDGLAMALCDINLRGEETGISLVAGLRDRGVACVMMTARPVGDALRAQAEALVPVLSKPISLGDLESLLGRAETEAP